MNWSEIDPYDFQKMIANLYERLGYEVEVQQQTRDGGVDIVAHKFFEEIDKTYRCIIQAKRYSSQKVGSPAIRDLGGTVQTHGADFGVIVTTSELTSDAKQDAVKLKIGVIERIRLERLLVTNGLLSYDDVDLDKDPNDSLYRRSAVIRILKDSSPEALTINQLLVKLHRESIPLNEEECRKILNEFSNFGNVLSPVGSNSYCYFPTKREIAELKTIFENEVASLPYPIDFPTLRMLISSSHKLSPEVLESLGLETWIRELLATNRISSLSENVVMSSEAVLKMKQAISKCYDLARNYDIFQVPNDMTQDFFRKAKIAYRDIWKEGQEKRLESSLDPLERELGAGYENCAVFISPLYEKVVLANNERLLLLQQTAMKYNEQTPIAEVKQFVRVNAETDDAFMKLVLSRIRERSQWYVAQDIFTI